MSQRVEAAMCLLDYGKGMEILANWDHILLSLEHTPSWDGYGWCIGKIRSYPVIIISPLTENRWTDWMTGCCLIRQAVPLLGSVLCLLLECSPTTMSDSPSTPHPMPRLLSEPDKLATGPPKTLITMETSILLTFDS